MYKSVKVKYEVYPTPSFIVECSEGDRTLDRKRINISEDDDVEDMKKAVNKFAEESKQSCYLRGKLEA